PVRRDGRERIEDEAALAELAMGNGQPPRSPLAPAPQCHVEVEHPWTPALSAAAAEFALHALQAAEPGGRLELAFDERNGVREIAAGSAVGRVEDDRRGIEQPEILVEPGDRGLDHGGGAAMPAVRAVRPNRDGVEMRCARHGGRPRRAPWHPPAPFPRPKRPAIARCARGWWPCAGSCAESIPAGGMLLCRPLATATPGWRSSAWRLASAGRTAQDGPSPATMRAICSFRPF